MLRTNPMPQVVKNEIAEEEEEQRDLTQKVRTTTRRMRAIVCVAIVLAGFLGISVTANFLIVSLVVAGEIKTTTMGSVMTQKGSDDVVKTAPAEESVPLQVAPMLDHETLDAVRSLSVTMDASYLSDAATAPAALGSKVTVKYLVTGYVWSTNVTMFFRTSTGDKIHIDLNAAFVETPVGNEVRPHRVSSPSVASSQHARDGKSTVPTKDVPPSPRLSLA